MALSEFLTKLSFYHCGTTCSKLSFKSRITYTELPCKLMPFMRTVRTLIISALMPFSSVQQCVTAVRHAHLLPLRSHPNSVLAGVNEAKWGVDESERKPGEKETQGKKERVREMNNKCAMLESIFKGRLEESGCKLGCSHDPSERTRPAPFLGHLYQTSQDRTSKSLLFISNIWVTFLYFF